VINVGHPIPEVCRVKFAWSLWTPDAKPRLVERGCIILWSWREVIENDPSGAVLNPGSYQEETDEAEDQT
jgi:hypothetical protein